MVPVLTPALSVAEPSDPDDSDSDLDAALEAAGTPASFFQPVRRSPSIVPPGPDDDTPEREGTPDDAPTTT